ARLISVGADVYDRGAAEELAGPFAHGRHSHIAAATPAVDRASLSSLLHALPVRGGELRSVAIRSDLQQQLGLRERRASPPQCDSCLLLPHPDALGLAIR